MPPPDKRSLAGVIILSLPDDRWGLLMALAKATADQSQTMEVMKRVQQARMVGVRVSYQPH